MSYVLLAENPHDFHCLSFDSVVNDVHAANAAPIAFPDVVH